MDAIIQSTDKNFLTPVGGAIVASPNEEFLDAVSETYAGRATAAPIAQFLAAVLSIGLEGYEKLRTQQEENRKFLESSLKEVAEKHSQRILNVYNPISVAMTLDGLDAKKIGKALYAARVNGARALEKNDFGVCCPQYVSSYINFDASIGIQKNEITPGGREVRQGFGNSGVVAASKGNGTPRPCGLIEFEVRSLTT